MPNPLRTLLPLLLVALLLAGCSTRSISNSGYPEDRPNPFYKGELSELDLLGIDPTAPIAEADIAGAFATHKRIELRKGAPILVVQSGAVIPDGPMITALDRYFTTSPFSGVPEARPAAGSGGYARLLRLVAAKGGYEVIFCYWGVLESAREGHATKLVSWVPVVGAAVPDETQRMQIRLRVAVVDVKTGSWSMFAPEPFEDAALTAGLVRRQSDQEQVALLKDKAYKAAVEAFVARYAEAR
jgi:hypothetical protein